MFRISVSLLLIGCLLDVARVRADDVASAGQTVCLTVRQPEADGGAGAIASMGLRELVRQAFLWLFVHCALRA
jgi:hypothetical protein